MRSVLFVLISLISIGRLPACTDWQALPGRPSIYEATRIESWGDYLVLATSTSIRVVDPRPVGGHIQVGALYLSTGDYGGVVAGDRLLMWGGATVWVVDLFPDRDPVLRAEVDFVDCGSINSATLLDDVLYVSDFAYNNPFDPTDGDIHVRAVDLSDPALPLLLGSIWDGERPITVATYRGLLVLADTGVTLLDVANPTAPRVVGSAALDARLYTIRIEGTRLAGIDFSPDNRLIICDLSDPTQPSFVASQPLPDYPFSGWGDLVWVNDEIVVANDERDFLAFEAGEEGGLQPCGGFSFAADTMQTPSDVAAARGQLWLLYDWHYLTRLPLFGDPALLQPELTLVGGAAQLNWDPGSAGQWTVYRSPSPDFPLDRTERLGTTTTPKWTDPGAQARGRAFYRVTMGRP